MSKISKIKVNGELYSISDLATQDALNSEVERAYAAEESIRAEFDGIRAKSDDNQLRLNELTKTDGDGSIQQQIDESIAKVIDQAPTAFDTLKELADWIEDDQTGAANMSIAITENKMAIEDINSRTVYLSEEEYKNLVDNGLVDPEVEYNIYEE